MPRDEQMYLSGVVAEAAVKIIALRLFELTWDKGGGGCMGESLVVLL